MGIDDLGRWLLYLDEEALPSARLADEQDVYTVARKPPREPRRTPDLPPQRIHFSKGGVPGNSEPLPAPTELRLL